LSFKDGPFQDLRVPLTWTAAAAAVIALIIAFALFASGHKVDAAKDGYTAVRGQFAETVAPVSGVISAPVSWTGGAVNYVRGYFFAVSENRRLRARVSELERWRDAAIALKNVNERYESLLRLRTEPPIPMVTARVVTDARGPFANARLVDVGTAQGVKIGNPALSDRGVVGRVVNVSRSVSRVLLLTDVESRTPVLINRTNARAIMTGDGGPNPRLDYVRGQNPIQAGDMILTSGDGGVYPRGLPVGVVMKDARGVWRVRLYADDASIDYVRVLSFEDFGALADQVALSQSQPPPLNAADAAQVKNAAAARAATRLVLPAAPAPPAGAAAPGTTAAPAPGGAPAAPATAAPPAPRPRPPSTATPPRAPPAAAAPAAPVQ